MGDRWPAGSDIESTSGVPAGSRGLHSSADAALVHDASRTKLFLEYTRLEGRRLLPNEPNVAGNPLGASTQEACQLRSLGILDAGPKAILDPDGFARPDLEERDVREDLGHHSWIIECKLRSSTRLRKVLLVPKPLQVASFRRSEADRGGDLLSREWPFQSMANAPRSRSPTTDKYLVLLEIRLIAQSGDVSFNPRAQEGNSILKIPTNQ